MSNFEPPKWGWLLRAGAVTVIAGVGVATFEAELFVFRRITLDQIVQYQAGGLRHPNAWVCVGAQKKEVAIPSMEYFLLGNRYKRAVSHGLKRFGRRVFRCSLCV